MKLNVAIGMLAGLAHVTRLDIYRLLVQAGPAGVCAGDIGSALDLAPATLSFHLRHMRQARLLRSRREGRMIFYFADYQAMSALMAYLMKNCCQAGTAACASACFPTKESAHEPPARSHRRARPR